MELSNLRSVYEHDGPFVTVYLEGRSPAEDSAEQVRLRWRDLRDRLADAGAPSGDVDAVEAELLSGTAGEEQADGRILVAAGGAVLLHEPWDAAMGAGDDAYWGRLPELGPYVREAARSVRALVVQADQNGARIHRQVVAQQHAPRELDSEDVEGSAERGVHKPRGQALAHNRIQRHAEEMAGRNARDVVSHLKGVASAFRPRVIVLAGEVQARTTMRDELTDALAALVVESDRGGLDQNASDEALAEDVARIAREESTKRAEHYTERLPAGEAHGNAVQGAGSVTKAAEQGAVDVLLLRYGDTGNSENTLLRSCAETDSTLDLVTDETELEDGIAALLRFPVG